MKEEPKKGRLPEERRLLKAAAIVLAILLAVPGVDAVARYAGEASGRDAGGVGIDAGFLTGTGSAYAALDRIEEAASGGGGYGGGDAGADGSGYAGVPKEFAAEVGFLPGARDVRASSGGSVIGYVVDHDCADTLDLVAEQMETGGWTMVSLGEVEGATFIKSDGACRWVLITCTQVGSATSVVARCVVE